MKANKDFNTEKTQLNIKFTNSSESQTCERRIQDDEAIEQSFFYGDRSKFIIEDPKERKKQISRCEREVKNYAKEMYNQNIKDFINQMILNSPSLIIKVQQRVPVQTYLIALCRGLMLNEFEISYMSLIFDKVNWESVDISLEDNIFVIGLIVKAYLISIEDFKMIFTFFHNKHNNILRQIEKWLRGKDVKTLFFKTEEISERFSFYQSIITRFKKIQIHSASDMDEYAQRIMETIRQARAPSDPSIHVKVIEKPETSNDIQFSSQNQEKSSNESWVNNSLSSSSDKNLNEEKGEKEFLRKVDSSAETAETDLISSSLSSYKKTLISSKDSNENSKISESETTEETRDKTKFTKKKRTRDI